MAWIRILLLALWAGATGATALPTVSQGALERLSLHSEWIGSRTVEVWLPPGYNHEQRYPVLYVHDGQMMFDANTTWNGQEWGMDEVAGELISTDRVRPFIVVAIHNAGAARAAEFFPQAPLQALTAAERESLYGQRRGDQPFFSRVVYSDLYLRFIFEELKPSIDARYPTLTDKANTFMLGSSMGGLISWYAASRYPGQLGAVASISTHWLGATRDDGVAFPAFKNQLLTLSPAAGVRVYFDTGDKTLDALYPKYQRQIDAQMVAAGWGPSQWQTRYVKNADHTENAWRERLHLPLTFLFAPDSLPSETK